MGMLHGLEERILRNPCKILTTIFPICLPETKLGLFKIYQSIPIMNELPKSIVYSTFMGFITI